jgi:hypothetical protein
VLLVISKQDSRSALAASTCELRTFEFVMLLAVTKSCNHVSNANVMLTLLPNKFVAYDIEDSHRLHVLKY